MTNWKQAFFLAITEIKVSKRALLFLPIFTSLITLGMISSTAGYLESNYVGFDLFFILMFTVAPIWAKPKYFQVQQINDKLLASPFVIMMNQLPIKKEIIVKSRFIIYLIYLIPVQLILLSSLYLFVPALREIMTVGTYLVFSLIWIAFSLYMGSIFPASEAGDKASSLKVIVYGIVMVIATIVFFTLFRLLSAHGIVSWTIYFAQHWPIRSSLISVLLSFIGLKYWRYYTIKTITKMDYL